MIGQAPAKNVASGASYDRAVSRQAEYSQRISAQGRDIGPTPPIADVERREDCRHSLLKFGQTYHQEACYLSPSKDQLQMISMIEESIRFGALYAFAMPRSSGKSTWCRIALHWAISFAHTEYAFLIGATKEKAVESLGSIKTWCRFKELWCADFPEISHAVAALGGVAHRQQGQLCAGRSTQIEWTSERIVLPVVPPPPNDPSPAGKEQFAKTSGIVLGVSGLTGDGIRGSLFTHPSGRLIRPSFVLLDDPQTDESAASDQQNNVREGLVAGAVLGMAGPDKRLAAVMPCTKIEPNDMACRILDRNRNPLWRGTCSKMLITMPKNLGEWDKYFEVYSRAVQENPGDLSVPNQYYIDRREILDEGAEPSWPERFYPDEVSAIQSAMHLYFRNRKKFFAEYQNDPEDEVAELEFLDAAQIARKTSTLARGIIPIDHDILVAHTDIHGDLLYYAVGSFEKKRFDGEVVDYATWPGQPTRRFSLRNANETLSKMYPGMGPEAKLRKGLDDLKEYLFGHEWKRQDGVMIGIERWLIDVGFQTRLVEKWIADQKDARIIPTKGVGIKVKDKPFDDARLKVGDQLGDHWRIMKPSIKGTLRRLEIDTNYWKSFVQKRLSTPVGDPGCLLLYMGDVKHHELIGEHLHAEYRKTLIDEKSGRKGDEWYSRPGSPDNHWLDNVVGLHVAASMSGAELSGASMKLASSKKKRAATPPPRRFGRA